MPEFQPISSTHIAAIVRPGCPNCQLRRMLLSKLEAGPFGVGYRTFECQKCGGVRRVAVPKDPMTPDMLGWLTGELKPPT